MDGAVGLTWPPQVFLRGSGWPEASGLLSRYLITLPSRPMRVAGLGQEDIRGRDSHSGQECSVLHQAHPCGETQDSRLFLQELTGS